MSILRLFALTAIVLFAGCAAQRPVLYPTEGLAQVGAASERDVNECQHLADASVRSTLPTETMRETAIGGGIGAASGVVGGAIFGSPGTGAVWRATIASRAIPSTGARCSALSRCATRRTRSAGRSSS
jgi:hypothetical protein